MSRIASQAPIHIPTSPFVRLVDLCVRHAWWTILLALALAIGATVYAIKHFAIHTDVRELLSPNLPWAQRSQEYQNEFPQRNIIVVLDGPTAEGVEQATTQLADALAARPDRFRAVSHPGSGPFFEQNGLLFLPTDQVKRITEGLNRADALLGTLASDPSLRGALDALSLVLVGVERGEIKLDAAAHPMTMAADTAHAVLAGRPASFSWRALASGGKPDPQDLRRFLQVEPVLDFSALQPGRAATEAIAQIASELNLAGQFQVRVRQTGIIPINDDEFGTIRQNAELNVAMTLLAVLIILWLALHSFRIILAAVVSLFVGLAISSAVGLFLVGALNLISIAFFVLFIGLGVDFGIQFSVRYRAERHDHPDLRLALHSSAMKAGGPLALAAIATAVGFASFLPTSYRGLSELGEIAGAGMIIAFLTSITLLPALLTVLNPPGERHPVGFTVLRPLDHFTERHRVPIIVTTLALVVLASPLLLFLKFDFNPLHLRSADVESVETYIELGSDPQTGANAIDLLAPNLAAADQIAQRLAKLPQVAQARTLSNLVPSDQEEKLKLIHDAGAAVDGSLNPAELEKPPTDQENIEALTMTADSLTKVAGNEQGSGPEAARRLSEVLSQLTEADPIVRERLQAVLVDPLHFALDQLRSEVKAQPVSVETIPADLRREWLTPDGRARVEVLPKGDPEDSQTLANFVRAVLAVEPNATGPGVLLVEAGHTVVRAFILSGAYALSAIFVLLLITLRRIGDVLLTLVPLLVAGLVTLELCVVFDLPLNFANILALPLLLGVGVAFKIYYIVAWRSGKTHLLQSSLTRAVLFSGMTTATAFGSLWMSSHPGTSSMGKLMALSLLCTMAAAVLFQPVLMGPPRGKAEPE
jgi:hopanoid biosynthesis associated RND transporter like protein HpnN